MSSETEPARSDFLRKPQRITPRIRPWLGVLLWVFSAATVMVFGQLFFPQALVTDPTATRDLPSLLVGLGAFAILLVLHVFYWRRVLRHMQAELALYQEAAGHMRFYPSESNALSIAPGAALTFSSGFAWFVGMFIGVGQALATLRTSDNTDSPALALVFALVCGLPFAIAMTGIGYLRLRRTFTNVRSGRLPF